MPEQNDMPAKSLPGAKAQSPAKAGVKTLSPYKMLLCLLGAILLCGVVLAGPADAARGLWVILTSQSTLVTDYVALAGMGAALVNAALTGLASTGLMALARVKLNGALLAAIWLTTGFGMFGTNVFNMAPITFGVWLYSRLQKEGFINYSLAALLSSTLSPVVSDIASTAGFGQPWNMVVGILAGTFVGFLMPMLASATTRVHGGYNLYNVGFAGGILAVFVTAIRKKVGHVAEQVLVWSENRSLLFAALMGLLLVLWIVLGSIGVPLKELWDGQRRIFTHSGRLISDYYLLYGNSAYLNMGLTGLLGLVVAVASRAPLNGCTMAAIFTMVGFGAFGKHLRNCWPPMLGAAIVLMIWGGEYSGAMPAVLFATGLAPIAGQYGWLWGILSGILHMFLVSHVAAIAGGLNLYSNGFAAGFVALLLIPIILAFSRRKERNET